MMKEATKQKIEACVWVVFVIGLMLTSCTTTRYITVEKIKTDTTIITKHQKDSVWLHDSIEVKKKGDSVLVERWHTKYQEKIVRDTLYKAKHDTIPQPYPVEKLVEKELSWFQEMQIWLGRVMLAIIAALVIYGLYKLERKFG